jgi:hypothetical protein
MVGERWGGQCGGANGHGRVAAIDWRSGMSLEFCFWESRALVLAVEASGVEMHSPRGTIL